MLFEITSTLYIDNFMLANKNALLNKKHSFFFFFEIIYSVDKKRLGLGLLVVKQITKGLSHHQPSIEVESTEGVGSAFTFFIENKSKLILGVKYKKFTIFNHQWVQCQSYIQDSESRYGNTPSKTGERSHQNNTYQSSSISLTHPKPRKLSSQLWTPQEDLFNQNQVNSNNNNNSLPLNNQAGTLNANNSIINNVLVN